jgi:Fur family transcriptional regulator, peroxide stress response regulator
MVSRTDVVMKGKSSSGVRGDASIRFEGLQRLCREHGLRLTHQRRTVLEALTEAQDHPTADQVYQRVHKRIPALSRGTVFRILDQFVGAGIIGKACHPGRGVRYDAITELHHHLVCMRCETMIDVFDRALDGIPIPDMTKSGFKVVDFRVQLRGLCRQCQQQIRKEERT